MEEKTPIVFISYSHDTPTHKRWVNEFASSLVKNGIDVRLDQWDLSPGDDIAKYMEKSVTESNRVLMICSELYVSKADDGVGGVGYESMVVTGELVRNLGTNKFIPIVRQNNSPHVLPKSVSTRFYINLSDDDRYQGEFDNLLRELHRVPAVVKPAIGANPFAVTPSKEELPTANKLYQNEVNLEGVSSPEDIYKSGLQIAINGDIFEWKKLIRNIKEFQSNSLNSWWADHGNQPLRYNEPEGNEKLLDGLYCWAPMMALAIAGVSSGRAKFTNQIALFEEIIYPKDWRRAGYTTIVNMPLTAAFIYQALHGAICLYTDQPGLAIQLIRTKVKFPNMSESLSIWRNHSVMGWPPSIGENSTEGWKFLMNLPEKWPWINVIFGSKEEFQTALVAYYMLLNVNEYVYVHVDGHIEELAHKDSMHLDIPLGFATAAEDIQRQSFRLLMQDAEGIKMVWRSLNQQDDAISKHWGEWVNVCNGWIGKVFFHYYIRNGLPHSGLIEELNI